MIVVDASAWVDKLRGCLSDGMSQTLRVTACASPPHVDHEVGSALLRLQRRGEVRAGEARTLIEKFSANPVERIRQPIDAVDATEILDNSTYSDAWYIALAKRLGCPLMTTDNGMRTAARIHGVRVVDEAGRL